MYARDSKYPKLKRLKTAVIESTYRICKKKKTHCSSTILLIFQSNHKHFVNFLRLLKLQVLNKYWTTLFPCKFLPQRIASIFINHCSFHYFFKILMYVIIYKLLMKAVWYFHIDANSFKKNHHETRSESKSISLITVTKNLRLWIQIVKLTNIPSNVRKL